MHHILDNVLSENELELLRMQLNFKVVDTGYDKLLCQRPDLRVNNLLTNKIKQVTKQSSLIEICAFLRCNKPDFDVKFRVHADRDPMADGRICKVAAVLYLYEDDSGTALFRHPEHGDRAKSKYVFTEDDGRWEAYFKCPSKANRLFIYDAKLFHGRYPWQVTKDRTVVVKFLG